MSTLHHFLIENAELGSFSKHRSLDFHYIIVRMFILRRFHEHDSIVFILLLLVNASDQYGVILRQETPRNSPAPRLCKRSTNEINNGYANKEHPVRDNGADVA